jgi:hypothetical protein
MQQRESAKKAAASAAAAAAAATGQRPLLVDNADGQAESRAGSGQNVIARTASWLDRAKMVLKDPSLDDSGSNESNGSEAKSEIMREMQEVQRLIHEGPVIQQTSGGLVDVLDQDEHRAPSPENSPEPEPADKRMRTGAEDAEALVGFIRSLRESTASDGQDY